ncbi:MAG: homoserine dehydrogenase [Chloroflexi bacterium]|nr:homoserine dehydrogenase [Chloroflexota bacterium]
MPDELRLAFLGFGNVGRALARLLESKRTSLEANYGMCLRVIGVATGRHGSIIRPEGVNMLQAIETVEEGQPLSSLGTSGPADSLAFLQAVEADALLESIPVNYQTGQPALGCIEAALKRGMHVISANKGPVVHGYQRLTELARQYGVRYLFESAVMDGAPIFSLWREALPAGELKSFRGILNSTTNLILTQMEQGRSYEQALAHAQAIGVAETDPSGDILGWDAAVKVAALVTVLMNMPLTPDRVARRGIDGLSLDHIQAAAHEGKRWKLICSAERTAGHIEARVQPELIDAADPLYTVMGTSSAITFVTDVLPWLTITEGDPGPMTTAYGMLADLVRAAGAL